MKHILIALSCVALAVPALAQPDTALRFMTAEISDEAADQVLSVATANLTRARGPDGQVLPPLSDAERAQPLLERGLVREIMDIAVASAVGGLCSLDWQNQNLAPLMARERARGDRTEHQLATVAIIHGMIQGRVASTGTCTQAGAAAAQTFYAQKWAP